MNVRVILDLDVGPDPTADAISFAVDRIDIADPDDAHLPTEWVEHVVVTILDDTFDNPNNTLTWQVLRTHVTPIAG